MEPERHHPNRLSCTWLLDKSFKKDKYEKQIRKIKPVKPELLIICGIKSLDFLLISFRRNSTKALRPEAP